MQTQLRQAVVVAFGRTPYCKARKGSFAQLHPVEYGAQTLLGVLARVPQLRPEDIGDVIMGCAMPFGVQGGNMARLIVQRAGLPDCVTAQTVNRYCSSGLQTIATAANAIRCGEEDVVIAGGVESMSLVPMLVGAEDADPWLAEHRPEVYTTMGITAENVARQWGISRADMDAMAVESHRRAAQAQAGGLYICFTNLPHFHTDYSSLATISPYCSFSFLINASSSFTVGISGLHPWDATSMEAEADPSSRQSIISRPLRIP